MKIICIVIQILLHFSSLAWSNGENRGTSIWEGKSSADYLLNATSHFRTLRMLKESSISQSEVLDRPFFPKWKTTRNSLGDETGSWSHHSLTPDNVVFKKPEDSLEITENALGCIGFGPGPSSSGPMDFANFIFGGMINAMQNIRPPPVFDRSSNAPNSRLRRQNYMGIKYIVENCPAENYHWVELTQEQRTAMQTSIIRYSYCAYPFVPPIHGMPCQRMEVIEAEIGNLFGRDNRDFLPQHSDYLRGCLQGQGQDERGHLIAANLGGTNGIYNLIPQHEAINRNVDVARHPQNYWFNMELAVGNFLRNAVNNRVYMEVRLQYENQHRRRPYEIHVRVRGYAGNVLVANQGGLQWDQHFTIPNRGI